MRKLAVLLSLLFALELLSGANANRDKKDLFLQQGDSPGPTAMLQRRPTGEMNVPEASVTSEAFSAEYPFLVWNTFLGSSAGDSGSSIAVDGAGNIYVAGTSSASWGDPRRPYSGGTDAFVAKLDANGTLLWHVFLGGGGSDSGKSIGTDEIGNVYLIGSSNAGWGSPKHAYTTNFDAFVAKISSNGTLLWNSFLGGGSSDLGYDVAVDKRNNVFVIGTSESSWGNPIRPYGGKQDAFVAGLSTGGNLVWNTFFYGPGYDRGSGIAIDPQGKIQIIVDFMEGNMGMRTGHIRLNADGVILFFKSYWASDRKNSSLTIDRDGTFYYASNLFGYDDDINPDVLKYDKTGSLLWGVDIQGHVDEDSTEVFDLDIDSNSHVFATGRSKFGCEWSPLNSLHGDYDALLSLVVPPANPPPADNYPFEPVWHMFLGGSGDDQGLGIAWHDGYVYIVGHSTAPWGNPNLPFTGGQDVFVARLKPEIPPAPGLPVANINGPLTACRPPQAIELDGMGSKAAVGAISGYSWGLQPPTGSLARLTTKGASATFIADIPGDYLVSLKVKDSSNNWSPFAYHSVGVTSDVPPGLALQGVRKEIHAWLIRRDYAKLTLSVSPPSSGCSLPISRYLLLRRAGQGAWLTLKDLSESAFRESNGVHALSLTDKYLEPGTAYTYRLIAFTADRKIVAATEVTL